MQKRGRVISPWFCVLIAGVLGLFITTAAKAQESSNDEQNVTPSAADQQAAQDANLVYRHAWAANTFAGKTLRAKEIAETPESSGAAPSASTALHSGSTRFEGDVSYLGGPVVSFAQSHAIYLLPNGNCPIATCWGNPEGFLKDLGVSEFIHITDQYVGLASSDRYTVGPHATINYKPTPKTAPLTDAEIQIYVHSVAAKTHQTGYRHIYHVFLPPGQDECFTATDGVCYSPDVPKTFAFCAYHSSVDFTDIGHVLYSVEPFQDVPGCSVRPGTPNGAKVDSTNNSLSHETFETITDPDGTAWINFSLVVLAGAEIGDECSFFVILQTSPTASEAFFDPDVVTIGAHRYAVQPEYSNSAHACPTQP